MCSRSTLADPRPLRKSLPRTGSRLETLLKWTRNQGRSRSLDGAPLISSSKIFTAQVLLTLSLFDLTVEAMTTTEVKNIRTLDLSYFFQVIL